MVERSPKGLTTLIFPEPVEHGDGVRLCMLSNELEAENPINSNPLLSLKFYDARVHLHISKVDLTILIFRTQSHYPDYLLESVPLLLTVPPVLLG